MKVRCIDGSWSSNELTTGKEYEVLSEVGCYYQLKINDKGIRYHCYVKSRFEVIKEHKDMKFKIGDKVRVREDLVAGNYYGRECFVGKMEYNKGKVFEIKGICEGAYIFEEDGFHWTDEMLEKVKKEKETQEKTFREVITDIKEGEVWECRSKYIQRFADGIQIYHKEKGKSTPSMFMSNNDKFKLQGKEYSFEEAFKAFEEGKEIESLASEIKYRRFDKKVSLFVGGENEDFSGINNDNAIFSINEIRSKWYINN